jgi:endonuclease YncB( thermonuclease family)
VRFGGLLLLVLLVTACGGPSLPAPPPGYFRIGHVADGDTVVLQGGATIRLVQIDTPEVFFHAECFGEQASAETKRLLPKNTLVRLEPEPATDLVDQYGRLLRYVIRADGLNVNVLLVGDGYAAPYFFEGHRGDRGDELEQLALTAQRERLGLWGACPTTPYAPEHGVDTGPP